MWFKLIKIIALSEEEIFPYRRVYEKESLIHLHDKICTEAVLASFLVLFCFQEFTTTQTAVKG